MSKHKIKRIERIFGWTKSSHKNAIIYFSKPDRERPGRSLKRKKKCRFNKGVHIFKKQKEHDFLRRIYCNYICENCGKQKFEVKDGDSGVMAA